MLLNKDKLIFLLVAEIKVPFAFNCFAILTSFKM